MTFIRFAHRCMAEFAKEAMVDQSMVGDEILRIKWAYDDPNPISKDRINKEHEHRFLTNYTKTKESYKNAKIMNNNNHTANTNYREFYNNSNNPYSYQSGYGHDQNLSDPNVDVTRNATRLAETLRAMEDHFNNNQ